MDAGELAENLGELLMEGVDGGADNWGRIKGTTRKIVGGSDRRDRGDPKSGRDSKKSDNSRRKSFNEDRYDRYGNNRGERRYAADPSGASSRRPDMSRRASSLDRGHFSDDRREQHNRYYSDSDESPRKHRKERKERREPEGVMAKSKRKLDDVFSRENDATAAIAAGLATVGTVFAASKLLESYQDRNTRSSRSTRRR